MVIQAEQGTNSSLDDQSSSKYFNVYDRQDTLKAKEAKI